MANDNQLTAREYALKHGLAEPTAQEQREKYKADYRAAIRKAPNKARQNELIARYYNLFSEIPVL